jgi:hypothetical protein
MHISESYLGIAFFISNNGNGTHNWTVNPPLDARFPEKSTAIVLGGQNEAILAARRAIGRHLSSTAKN